MTFECQKTENCFADSQTYEYRIPITAEAFMHYLSSDWDIRCNHRLRRPVFLAERNQIHIKAILAGTVLRISFPDQALENEKNNFEKWMETLDV